MMIFVKVTCNSGSFYAYVPLFKGDPGILVSKGLVAAGGKNL